MSATHAVVAVGCLIVASVVAVVVAIRDAVAKIEAVGGVIADTARAHGALLRRHVDEHMDRLLAEMWARNEHLDRLLASRRAPIDPRDAEMWARRVLDRDSDEWIIREVSQ